MSEKFTDLVAEIADFIRTPEGRDFDALMARAASLAQEGAPSEGHLDRQIATATWRRYCLDRITPSPVLSLVTPTGDKLAQRLAGELAGIIHTEWSAGDSLEAIGPRGMDSRKTRGFLAARQRDSRPILVIATRGTLSELIRSLERFDLRFRLAAASVAVVGVERSLASAPTIDTPDLSTLIDQTAYYLGLSPERFVQRLDPTPKTRLFTDSLSGGDPEYFVAPHWVRLEVTVPDADPPAATGGTGRLRVLDLANLGGPMEIETEILGTLEPKGFRLLESRP